MAAVKSKPGKWATPLIPALEAQKQGHHCECETSLLCIFEFHESQNIIEKPCGRYREEWRGGHSALLL